MLRNSKGMKNTSLDEVWKFFNRCCKYLPWQLQMPSLMDVASIFDGNCKCLLRWMLQTSSMAIVIAFFDGCCKHLRWQLQMPSSMDVASIFNGNCNCLLRWMLQTSSMAIVIAFNGSWKPSISTKTSNKSHRKSFQTEIRGTVH